MHLLASHVTFVEIGFGPIVWFHARLCSLQATLEKMRRTERSQQAGGAAAPKLRPLPQAALWPARESPPRLYFIPVKGVSSCLHLEQASYRSLLLPRLSECEILYTTHYLVK